MLNLLPGDRLWNRFRVEEASQHGAEAAIADRLEKIRKILRDR